MNPTKIQASARGEECISCGKPSTRLCDYKIGAPIAGFVRIGNIQENRFHAVISAQEPMFSCDVPICDECAHEKGIIHASGKGGFTESIDYCPFHASQKELPVKPMTENEINNVRREINVHYKRKQIVSIR